MERQKRLNEVRSKQARRKAVFVEDKLKNLLQKEVS